MKHLAIIQADFLKISNLEKDIEVAKNNDKKESVFLGGTVENDNEWRKKIKKEFKDKLILLDPYEKNWEPEDDIYDEIAGMQIADYIVFYKGGEFTDKEKDFLDTTSKTYKTFDNFNKLQEYLQLLLDMNKI